MNDRKDLNQRIQQAVDDAKLALAVVLGIVGIIYVPLTVWGAGYYFMVGAMIVSVVAGKNTLQEAESTSTVDAPSDSLERAPAPTRPYSLFVLPPPSPPERPEPQP